MRVDAVDERDSRWEDHDPRFRVFLFSGQRSGHAWTTTTYDLTGVDALDAVDWARDRADDGPFAVALVREEHDGRTGFRAPGLVWVVGCDANSTPSTEAERYLADRMHGRTDQPWARTS